MAINTGQFTKVKIQTFPNTVQTKSQSRDLMEERKSSECNRIINAPKGIGINEQNIFQIICKPSDQFKDSNPYLNEIFKSKLDEKNKEVTNFI